MSLLCELSEPVEVPSGGAVLSPFERMTPVAREETPPGGIGECPIAAAAAAA